MRVQQFSYHTLNIALLAIKNNNNRFPVENNDRLYVIGEHLVD